MDKRRAAFVCGLRGFLGCVVGYMLVYLLFHIHSISSDWAAFGFITLICTLPGLCWGVFLGSIRLTVWGAVTHSIIMAVAFFAQISGASNFFSDVTMGSSWVQFAAHAALMLGLTWYLTGIVAGTLLGATAGGKHLWNAGARIGARAGLYVPLTVWAMMVLTQPKDAIAFWNNQMLAVPLAVCVGFTLFAALLGREGMLPAHRKSSV